MERIDYTTNLTPEKLYELLESIPLGIDDPIDTSAISDIPNMTEAIARNTARTEQYNAKRIEVLKDLREQIIALLVNPIDKKIEQLEEHTKSTRSAALEFAIDVHEETNELPKTVYGQASIVSKRTSQKVEWADEKAILEYLRNKGMEDYIAIKESVNKTKLKKKLTKGELEVPGTRVYEETDYKLVALGAWYDLETNNQVEQKDDDFDPDDLGEYGLELYEDDDLDI